MLSTFLNHWHLPRRSTSRIAHRSLSSSLSSSSSCRISPKAVKTFFSSILISWVGLHVAMYLSHLSANDRSVNIASMLPSDDAMDGTASSRSGQADPRHKTKNMKKLQSSSSHPKTSAVHAKSVKTVQHRFRQINRDASKTKQQFTRNALNSSQLYVQKLTKNVSVSRHHHHHHHHLKHVKHAFAAVDYFDTSTMMGDNDDDSLDTYYAMDDDAIRGSGYKKWSDGSEPICSTPSFYRLYRPNCNEIHATVSGYHWLVDEVPTSKQQHTQKHHDPQTLSRYLGSGMYRQVFLLERQFAANNSDEVVFKCMKRFSHGDTFEQRIEYKPNETVENFELYDDMRKDSMVMEQLTHSPRIANIYSFCSLSSIIEYAPGNIEKYVMPTEGYKQKEDDDDPTPINKIDGVEKLTLALELAKGIAAMHGHSDGVIANVDVQIGQFCRGKDGLVKILDFNRAEVMLYDERRGEYCRFENGKPPDGSLRAPEEIIDAPLTEKIDVYSLGNVFYSILTGLLVNGEYTTSQAHSRIIHGKTEDIDVRYFESRSQAEYALVKIIQLCWTYDAEERPSIFDIVALLENEVKSFDLSL